jgi:hypothetical protein
MSSGKHLLPFLCFAQVAIGQSPPERKAKSMPGSDIHSNDMASYDFSLIKAKSRFGC